MKLTLNLVFLCIYLLANKGNEPEINKAEWLLGTWEMKAKKGSIFEAWIRINDQEFAGKSYMLKGTDTLIFETLQLLEENKNLTYSPKVQNQNGGHAIIFKAVEVTDNKLVFQNLLHDFPQTISYQKIAPDSMVAKISGVQNDKVREELFPMKRIKIDP